MDVPEFPIEGVEGAISIRLRIFRSRTNRRIRPLGWSGTHSI